VPSATQQVARYVRLLSSRLAIPILRASGTDLAEFDAFVLIFTFVLIVID
jgi:hypothetical protein